jgi:hypothetical protein
MMDQDQPGLPNRWLGLVVMLGVGGACVIAFGWIIQQPERDSLTAIIAGFAIGVLIGVADLLVGIARGRFNRSLTERVSDFERNKKRDQIIGAAMAVLAVVLLPPLDEIPPEYVAIPLGVFAIAMPQMIYDRWWSLPRNMARDLATSS